MALSPRSAWEKAVREISESASSQGKVCPRGAYLGLCEEGAVSGIPRGDYCKANKNKEYALTALRLLKQDDSRFPDEKRLWQAVMEGEEKKTSHQQQMDVVLSLWRARLIAGQR